MKNQLKNIRKQPKTKMYAIFDSIDQTLWRAISNYELQQRLQRLQWLQWLQLLQQGQIGLDRSASWSLIPIHGRRGSGGMPFGSLGVKG